MIPLARLYHRDSPPGLYSSVVLSGVPSGRGANLISPLLSVLAVEFSGHIRDGNVLFLLLDWLREEGKKDTKAHAMSSFSSAMVGWGSLKLE